MKCFYVMGKSSSGKDTIFKRIQEELPALTPLITHTTRPKRDGEVNGKEYYFDSEDEYIALKESGNVIEERSYTVFVNGSNAVWHYYTVNDSQFSEDSNIIGIGTLESYNSMISYFGNDVIYPIFIEVPDDGIRLQRAIDREMGQKTPNYIELCRRFLKDQEDFSNEKLNNAKIYKIFYNINLDECVLEVKQFILDTIEERR